MIETQLNLPQTENNYSETFTLAPTKPSFVVRPPLLETLLVEQGDLPAYSIIMGVCEDNLPLVFDLKNSVSGAMLIVGDDEFYNTNLLHSMIASAIRTNTKEELNFHLISPFVNQVVSFQQDPHYKLGFEPDHPDCNIVIEEFVRLIKSRQDGEEIVPMHILGIDNLDQLLENFSKQDLANFEWLLKNGPANGIWVFATINSQKVNDYGLNNFKTKLFSQIRSGQVQRSLFKNFSSDVHNLVAGSEAIIAFKNLSRPIWIPQFEDLGFGNIV